MPLTAAIEVPAGQTDAKAMQIRLRVSNPGHGSVSILNPDMGVPSPSMNFPYSNEVYQFAMLISFSFVEMSVTDEAGEEVPQDAIATWATPALRPRLELDRGDSFDLAIPIGVFYQLTPKTKYAVSVTYGDKELKVSAEGRINVP